MSFGRFPAGGPWLLQLSLSNAVWTRTCNFTLSCILVSGIFTVCPGAGGGDVVGQGWPIIVFLCIVQLLTLLIRRAQYGGAYFKRPHVLVTFYLTALVKETQCFGGLLYCFHQVKWRNAQCWVVRDCNSSCLRRTARRNVVFPQPKSPIIPVRQFRETSLLRTFRRNTVDVYVYFQLRTAAF